MGPIRSVRFMDPDIVSPLGGVIAFSGGTPANVALIRETPTVQVDENNAGDAFFRESIRFAPHNLYGRTALLLGARGRAGAAAAAVHLSGDRGDVPEHGGDRPVPGRLRLGVRPHLHVGRGIQDVEALVRRRWRSWTSNGAQVAPTNVIVQFVELPAGRRGPAHRRRRSVDLLRRQARAGGLVEARRGDPDVVHLRVRRRRPADAGPDLRRAGADRQRSRPGGRPAPAAHHDPADDDHHHQAKKAK